MPSRWASSCSSKLVLRSTAIGADPGGTPGTGSGSASGALLRAANGVHFAFFFFGICSSASACLPLLLFLSLSLLFLLRGWPRSHGIWFITLALFVLYCFLFFSSGQIRWAGLPSSLLGGPLRHGPFSFPFRVFQACLSSRTHQVSQATSFQLILVGQLFIWIPHCIVLQNLVFPDVCPLELLDHFLHPPVCFEGFP